MVAWRIVKHHNAFHTGAVDQQAEVVFWTLHSRCVVVLAYRAADDDACFHVDASQHDVQNIAAHVVKVHINALGAMRFETVFH